MTLYILIGILVFSGLGIGGMLYYKRWQEEHKKTNVSFHHIPIFHIHEYSLFLHKILSKFSQENFYKIAAHLYLMLQKLAKIIGERLGKTRIVKQFNETVDHVRGKQYVYAKHNQTSDFLRAIAEHKKQIRGGQ